MATDQASAVAHSNAVLLTFVVGPYRLCASSENVAGIIPPPPLARLPGSSHCQRGIFFHHGRTALVMGLRCKFGLSHRTHSDTGQIILVEIKNELAGFWVDEVVDAPETQHAVWRDTPPALQNGIVDRLAVLNQDLYLYVDFEKLLYADADEVAAVLGTLAPAKEKDPADARQNAAPDTKSAIETTPASEAATATTGAIPADVTASAAPVAPRAPMRAAPSRAPVGGKATPRHRAAEARPIHRTAALLSNTRMGVGGPARDWGHYTTSGNSVSAAHNNGASENQSRDNTAVWVLGSITFIALLMPLFWFLLSSSDRSGSRSASSATKPSAVAENSSAGYSASTATPTTSTLTGTTSTPAGQAEILRVDTADFVMTVERGGKPEKSSVVEAKTPAPAGQPSAATAKPQTTPQGQGDWQEITHVVERGDTLWDIANRYLGNPFKYPELAKLSEIRNPDLIHPGDRIHIKKKIATPR